MIKSILFSTAMLLFIPAVFAQVNKDELQKQRLQLKKEIEQTEKVLNETRKTTKENLGQLIVMNKKINLQDKVIKNISGELKFIDNDIVKSQREVNKLSKVLDTLKQEFAKSMVYAYKNRNNYDFLNFIFSASSFNDAFKRITYLKSYRNYREMQGQNILRTQELQRLRIAELSGNKQKKNYTLQEQSKELTELEKQQKEKERIVSKLKSRQNELSSQITNKRKQDAKLRNMITAMIKREIDKARQEAKDKAIAEAKARAAANTKNTDGGTPTTSTTTAPTTRKTPPKEIKRTESVLVTSDADKVLDASFERNRGSLPWPADGFILIPNGSYTIPGTHIKGENPGVTIGTQVGASVKSIFDGEVTLVSYMEDKQVVFIKHGKYFSVYSNLASASVSRGQTVKTGQVIGRAAANDDGQGQVDLILMKESNNVNPEAWLRRK